MTRVHGHAGKARSQPPTACVCGVNIDMRECHEQTACHQQSAAACSIRRTSRAAPTAATRPGWPRCAHWIQPSRRGGSTRPPHRPPPAPPPQALRHRRSAAATRACRPPGATGRAAARSPAHTRPSPPPAHQRGLALMSGSVSRRRARVHCTAAARGSIAVEAVVMVAAGTQGVWRHSGADPARWRAGARPQTLGQPLRLPPVARIRYHLRHRVNQWVQLCSNLQRQLWRLCERLER